MKAMQGTGCPCKRTHLADVQVLLVRAGIHARGLDACLEHIIAVLTLRAANELTHLQTCAVC